MSNKRNTRAGTSSYAETSTAQPTVPLPKKKRKPVSQEIPQELHQEPTQVSQVPQVSQVSQVSQVFIVVMFAGLDLAIKLHGSPFFLIYLRSTS